MLFRVPLTKHKSMREALREKGIEIPYQDPALKYMANEYAGSASMYINNYADVGTPSLRPLHTLPPIPFHPLLLMFMILLFIYNAV